jgi:hypothetical protein
MAWRVLSLRPVAVSRGGCRGAAFTLRGLVASFFFLAMMLGVLTFVTGLVLGRPRQAVIGGVIAAFFLVAGHLARTRRSP